MHIGVLGGVERGVEGEGGRGGMERGVLSDTAYKTEEFTATVPFLKWTCYFKQ